MIYYKSFQINIDYNTTTKSLNSLVVNDIKNQTIDIVKTPCQLGSMFPCTGCAKCNNKCPCKINKTNLINTYLLTCSSITFDYNNIKSYNDPNGQFTFSTNFKDSSSLYVIFKSTTTGIVMISLGNYLVYQSDNCLLSNNQFIVVDILPKLSPETIQKAMITKKY